MDECPPQQAMDFSQPELMTVLDAASAGELDALAFGVVRLDGQGRVTAYNRYESESAGLPPTRVLGRHFFTEVAPCMNNALVAGRYATERALDAELDYVFTLRLKPERVRLRLLQDPHSPLSYLLVRR